MTQHTQIQNILKYQSRPIVLIGMMGSGKTHFGRTLANDLGLDFVDSDKLVEEKAGCSISEIFSAYGEEKFRDVEAKTIQALLEKGAQIIATGGGAVLNPETLQAINEKSVSVWLQADIDTLFARVSKNKGRPLLQTENPKETLKTLLAEREPLYATAHLTVSTDENSIEDKQQDLLQRLYEHLQQR